MNQNHLKMLLVLVLLIFPSVILTYENEKCNVLLRDVNVKWISEPIFEEHQTTDGLENLHDAYKINIHGDHVPVLCKNTFANFPNLLWLNLRSNRILEINPGAFSKLDQLLELNLNNNHLEEIKEGVFNNLSVATLRLENNFIETVSPNAFDDMPRLHMLLLSHNKIRFIDGEWFKNTPVTYLSLNHNEIASIQKHAFKNLQILNGTELSKRLPVIDLSSNKIQFVHSEAFDNLGKIRSLYLDGNQIESLHENLFSKLEYMRGLYLNDNQIRCLPDNLENILKAEIVGLDMNPWNCTCAETLHTWSSKNNRDVDINLALVICNWLS